ncbi:MAG: rRNA methyltransferase, partial [Polyangiaceae bacterium]|nr:rRNA methyltransferase [Polyangiaceae bacterium]
VIDRRPEDVLRFFLVEGRLDSMRSELRVLAERRVPYRVVSREELDRIAGGLHHEGVCVIARELLPMGIAELERRVQASSGPLCLLYLDAVRNPHNLGAILRSAAHFGARAVLGPAEETPELGPAAARIAEGGAEHVSIVRLRDPERELARLGSLGMALVGTDSEAKSSLFDVKLPPRSILLLGAEREGLGSALRNRCDLVVRIPGTGSVQSLNVAAASAVMLAEHLRQNPRR